MFIPENLGKTVGKARVQTRHSLFKAMSCHDSPRHAVVEAVEDQTRVFEELMYVGLVELFGNSLRFLTHCAIKCVGQDLGL